MNDTMAGLGEVEEARKEHCEVNRSAIGEHLEVVRDLSSWALDKFKDSLGVLARMQYLLSKKQLVGKVDEVAPLRSRAAANVLSRMTALRKHFVDKLSTMSAGDDRETFVIFLGFLSSAEVHHNVMQMVNESRVRKSSCPCPRRYW